MARLVEQKALLGVCVCVFFLRLFLCRVVFVLCCVCVTMFVCVCCVCVTVCVCCVAMYVYCGVFAFVCFV